MASFTPLPDRDAYPSIRGFVYQVDRTILAWLNLPDGAVLHCEAGEDIDQVRRIVANSDSFDEQQRLSEQVKHREGSLTLRSSEILDAIANFAATQRLNPEVDLRYRFFTNAITTQERGVKFPNDAFGIDAWNLINAGGFHLDDQTTALVTLKDFLVIAASNSEKPVYQDLVEFISSMDLEDFRAKLVARFEFSMGNESVSEQQATVRQRLFELGYAHNDDEARAIYDRLFVSVFHLLGEPEEKLLDHDRLTSAIEEVSLTGDERDLLVRIRPYFQNVLTRMTDLQSDVTEIRAGVEDIRLTLKSDTFQSMMQEAVSKALALHVANVSSPPLLPTEVESDVVDSTENDSLNQAITDAANNTLDERPDRAIVLLEQIQRERTKELTPRTRYRILANLGHAHRAQHDVNLAASLYEAAANEQPNDFEARQWLLVALLQTKRMTEAQTLAQSLREEAPDHTRIAALWISSLSDDVPLESITSSLTPSLLTQAEVALTLAHRARRAGDLNAAMSFARTALATAEKWTEAREELAITLLESTVAAWRASGGGTLADKHRHEVQEARNLLISALAQLPSGTQDSTTARYHLNISTAETLLEHHTEADTHIVTAYRLLPTDPDVALRYARWRDDRGQLDAAIQALEEVPQEVANLEILTLHAHFRIKRNGQGDSNRAEELLNIGQQILGDSPATFRAVWLEVYANLLCDTARIEELREISDGVARDLIPSVARHAVIAHFLQHAGERQDAETEAHLALSAVDESTPEFDRQAIALLAESFGWWRAALSLWQTLTVNQPPSSALYHLLTCARNAGEDQLIINTCRELREHGYWDLRCLDAEIDVLARHRAWSEALPLLQKALTLTDDGTLLTHFRMNLALVARRANRSDIANEQLQYFPPASAVDVETGQRAVEALRYGPDPIVALNYAYDLWRRFRESTIAWDALIGASNMTDGPSVNLFAPSTISIGSAFSLRDEQTGEVAEWIIEEGENPLHAYRELAPDDRLAQAALGHRAGDTITVTDRMQLRRYTVQDVVPKTIFRWRWCLENYAAHFPESAYVWMISLPENPTHPQDFAELNAALYEALSHRELLVEAYQNRALSLSLLADGLGMTEIDTVKLLAETPQLRVRSWPEDGGGLQNAYLASRSPKTVVLDLSALGTLFALESTDLIGAFGGSCIIARSALELIRDQIIQGERKGESGYIVSTPLGPLVLENEPGKSARRREKWQEMLEQLEQFASAELGRPANANSADLPGNLTDIFGRYGAEAIGLAQQPDRVLWTDDWIMTAFAQQGYGVVTAWTQPMLLGLVERNQLEADRYVDLILQLVTYGYSWTVLEEAHLSRALKKSTWDVDQPPLSAAIDCLGSNVLTLLGTCRAVGPLLVKIWRESLTEHHAARITRRICERIMRRSDGRTIVTALYRNLHLFFHLDALHERRAKRVIVDCMQTGPHGLWLPPP